jgi:hypothetical protein
MSEEPARTKKPHPIRLAVFMLIGAGFGALLGPTVQGRIQDAGRDELRYLAWVVCAALVGGVIELFARVGQRD